MIQPWEFGSLPVAWLRAMADLLADEVGGLLDVGILPEAEQILGAETYLSGSMVPNYTLFPPWMGEPITIMGNPLTVSAPTTLSGLLNSNMGNVWWAACRGILH
jgi:hypothetical protein